MATRPPATASISAGASEGSAAPLNSTVAPSPSTSVTSTWSSVTTSKTTTSKTRSAQQETATAAGEGYTYSSSTIVRVALAASIIVIVLTALLLFMKISGWIRYRQRVRREHALTTQHAGEARARAFELAAWADTPGLAPVEGSNAKRRAWWRRDKRDKDDKVTRRGRTNAYAVYEWEGVPS